MHFTNFKHIFIVWWLYKNQRNSWGTSEVFLQFARGVITHSYFLFCHYLLVIILFAQTVYVCIKWFIQNYWKMTNRGVPYG